MRVAIVGFGSYSKTIINKYKLFNNIHLVGLISANVNQLDFNINVYDSINNFITHEKNINDVYFDLCVPTDVIYDTFIYYVNNGALNFIFPKSFTKNNFELDIIIEMKKTKNIKILISSQWSYLPIFSKISQIILDENIKNINCDIVFNNFIDDSRKKNYTICNALLPHQIHILHKIGLLNNNILDITTNKNDTYMSEINIKTDIANILLSNNFDAPTNEQYIKIIIEYFKGENTTIIAKLDCCFFTEGPHTFPYLSINNSVIPELNYSTRLNKLLDPLENMIEHFTKIDDNIEQFYQFEKIIHDIESIICKKNALIIGAGIFGFTALKNLSDAGLTCTILDKQPANLLGASCVNQCRVHRGYHYPRDDNIIKHLDQDYSEFIDVFKDAIVFDSNHYYAISENNSKTSPTKYVEFLEKHNLPYVNEYPNNVLVKSTLACYKVDELSFDIYKLREIVNKYLGKNSVKQLYSSNIHSIDVIENNKFKATWIHNKKYYCEVFGIVINSTYANINYVNDYFKQHKLIQYNYYQYELVEIFIVDVPSKWKITNTGIAIMDGPYCGIMSLGFSKSEYVLYDVELSVLETIVGIYPVFKNNVSYYLKTQDKRFNAIIEKMKVYFPEIIECKLLYSLFQTRIVLKNADATDTRPTLLHNPFPGYWYLFSGKIVNCISVSKEILNSIKQ